ncbi:MAG: hypothetical protein ACTSX2_08180 [Candidatus Thorarchaeota archaeon]
MKGKIEGLLPRTSRIQSVEYGNNYFVVKADMGVDRDHRPEANLEDRLSTADRGVPKLRRQM